MTADNRRGVTHENAYAAARTCHSAAPETPWESNIAKLDDPGDPKANTVTAAMRDDDGHYQGTAWVMVTDSRSVTVAIDASDPTEPECVAMRDTLADAFRAAGWDVEIWN